MKTSARLYEAHTLPAEIAAAHPQAAAYVRAFSDQAGCAENNRSAQLVANVRTSMLALHLNLSGSDEGEQKQGQRHERGFLFPVTVNDGGGGESGPVGEPNGYVVSPCTTYVHYGYEEARLLPNALVRGGARALLASIQGALALARADAVVILNNWLVSTNLHPIEWTGAPGSVGAVAGVLRELISFRPHHAVMVRSLNPFCNHQLMQHLQREGFLMVPSRQVYLFDARHGEKSDFASTRNYLWDCKLLNADKKATYTTEHPLRQPDTRLFERIAHLYGQLYLQKYSLLNPQYQPEWFQRGHQEGWLDLAVLRHRETGQVDGVVGWFGNDSVFTTPVVGYDTALPQRLGLYRMLIAITMRQAVAKRAVLNLSSGAARFKRLRGGAPEIEYSAVYVRHLPAHRRAIWHGLSTLLRNVAVPLLRRHEL